MSALCPVAHSTTLVKLITFNAVNADTSWLVQLPIPDPTIDPQSASSTSRPRKRRQRWFNLILDPWLSGPQSDVASWFSKQWHVVSPAYASIEDVQRLCGDIERYSTLGEAEASPEEVPEKKENLLDAILLSHEFTDHTHKETLLQCHPSTPVLAPVKAASLVRSWKHFDTVFETKRLVPGSDWRGSGQTSKGNTTPLPDWIGVWRLEKPGDAFYYHSAVLIAFDLGQGQGPEAIAYSPHGIRPDAVEALSPPVALSNGTASAEKGVPSGGHALRTLALLHGLHDVSISWGQQLNLGAHNAVQVQKKVRPRWWVGTHDEVKKGGGLVSWFLRRKVYTPIEVLEWAEKHEGEKPENSTEYLELGNGESLVLS